MENLIEKGGPAAADAQLAARARAGDREAFTRLVLQNEALLFRVAMAILENPSDAQDAAQEAVFRAWRKIGQLRQPEYFRTWLVKILRRECQALLKQRSKHRHGEMEEALDAAETGNPDLALEVSSALNSLPPSDRSLLTLYYYDGLSVRELSRLLRISEGAVRQRLRRAREKFKQQYQEDSI